jgi:hypothetical protein
MDQAFGVENYYCLIPSTSISFQSVYLNFGRINIYNKLIRHQIHWYILYKLGFFWKEI